MSSVTAADSNTLAHFVARKCQPFTPRAIRLNARKEMNFNVMMFDNEDMNQANAERSVTINISKDGCFLFSCHDWSNISMVWFVVNELNDKTPIIGENRWRMPWGKTMAIHGIGIIVKKITPQQLVQLREQYYL